MVRRPTIRFKYNRVINVFIPEGYLTTYQVFKTCFAFFGDLQTYYYRPLLWVFWRVSPTLAVVSWRLFSSFLLTSQPFKPLRRTIAIICFPTVYQVLSCLFIQL